VNSVADQPRLPDRYRLYIDESGDHTYKLLADPSHRYLALLGVWFRQKDHYNSFADDLEKLKRDIFGPRPDKPVILHRSDIIGRKGPFGILRNGDLQGRFDAGLLEIVGRQQFTMVCVVIDKMRIPKEFHDGFNPYHRSLAALMDQYIDWLHLHDGVGDVMAEGRGKVEDNLLKEEYHRGFEGVSQAVGIENQLFPAGARPMPLTSRDIKIQPKSANIAGLQLADLLAHPAKQACLIENGLIPETGDSFGRRLYAAAKGHFLVGGLAGAPEGYGKILI
jgi:hypothetical protein